MNALNIAQHEHEENHAATPPLAQAVANISIVTNNLASEN